MPVSKGTTKVYSKDGELVEEYSQNPHKNLKKKPKGTEGKAKKGHRGNP